MVRWTINVFYLFIYLLLFVCFSFFGGGDGQREVQKGGDVVIDLDVSLEELYTGNFVEVDTFCIF